MLKTFVYSGMWGLQKDGTFPSAHETLSLTERLLRMAGVSPAADIYGTVMGDIQKVRKQLALEIQQFQTSLQNDYEKGTI